MKQLGLLPLFLAVSGLAACGADFDPGSRVSTLRVLAVQADQPFARPGETVTLSSLSYDPEGRTVNFAWATCANPEESTVEGCLTKLAADSQASGAQPFVAQGAGLDSFSFTVPGDALTSLPVAARANAFVGVLNVACPGNLSFESGPGDLPVRCTDPASGRELGLDEYVVGLKRVFVKSQDRNQNPSIARVSFDGSDWPEGEVKVVSACDTDGNSYSGCSGLSKHQLGAYVTPGSAEAGRDEFGTSFSEQLVVEYYATEGIFEYEDRIAASPQTGWAARKRASGTDLTLWFVVHDDRGGVNWTERQVHVN